MSQINDKRQSRFLSPPKEEDRIAIPISPNVGSVGEGENMVGLKWMEDLTGETISLWDVAENYNAMFAIVKDCRNQIDCEETIREIDIILAKHKERT